MHILIRRLGPIDEAELKLGDITVLIGPPNVGKSYTLKVLYALFLPLDRTTLDNLLRQTLRDILEPNKFDKLEEAVHTLIGLVVLYKLIHPPSHELDKILDMIKHKINADQIVVRKEGEHKIIASLKRRMGISLEEVNKLVEENIQNVLQEILPTHEDSQIIIKDKSLPKTLLPELLETLKPLEKNPLTHTRLGSFESPELYMNIKDQISLILVTKERRLVLENVITINIDERSLLFKTLEKRILHTFKAPKMTDEFYQKVLSSPTSLYMLIPIRDRHHLTLFLRRIRPSYESIYKSISTHLEKEISKSITRLYQDLLGIQSILFIPFGRSPLVYQLEYISQEPIQRREILSYYETDRLSYSYISKLSRGRSMLSEGKYDEKIIKIFKPIIQGDLWYDKETGVVMYKRWGFEELKQKHKGVPIKWASALASEITGILLPILDTPEKSCIFIEEPESQLHPSAQVLMALGLAGLASTYGHKLVISTHSDVLAVTLAYIKALKPSKKKVLELIRKLLKMQGIHPKDEDLEFLAEKASSATNIDMRFYYYEPTPSGVIVREEKPTNIMEHVPGITKVIDILASWAINL